MPRQSLSKKAAQCSERILELQNQIDELLLDNHRKRFEDRVLSASCGLLLWLRQQQLLARVDEDSSSAAEHADDQLTLLDELLDCLENPQNGAYGTGDAATSADSDSSSHPSASCLGSKSLSTGEKCHQPLGRDRPAVPFSQPLAPPDDLLMVMRQLASNPPPSGGPQGG
jgi:hypothetical protein